MHASAAKFNCTVPGTLPISNSPQCPALAEHTTSRDHEPTSHPLTSTTATAAEPTTVASQNNPTLTQQESPLVYVVGGTVGPIAIIIILLVITCLVLYIRHIKRVGKCEYCMEEIKIEFDAINFYDCSFLLKLIRCAK